MTRVVLVVGIGVQAIAWRAVATGRAPFWPTSAATLAVVGVATVLVADPACCAEVPFVAAVVVGLVTGALLYLATRLVVAFATRAPALASEADDAYGRGEEVPANVVWALTLLVVVPGEELFWRGLVLPELERVAGPLAGSILAWAAGVGVTALSGSLPFLAAAVVGGAVWTALAAWGGGVVAALASHAVWTAAMIAWRPGTGRAKVPG